MAGKFGAERITTWVDLDERAVTDLMFALGSKYRNNNKVLLRVYEKQWGSTHNAIMVITYGPKLLAEVSAYVDGYIKGWYDVKGYLGVLSSHLCKTLWPVDTAPAQISGYLAPVRAA